MSNATAAANREGGQTAPGGGDLAEIFRQLQRSRRTGTLKVTNAGGRHKYVYFNNGEIELVKSKHAKTLIGRALVKRRKITEADLEKALRRHRTTGEKLGKCCTSLALVKDEDIREALAFQAIEEIADLFTWPAPKSEFHRGEPPLDIFDFDDLSARVRLSPEALVKEAQRRAAELEQVRARIPSFQDVYAPSPEAYYDMKPMPEGSPERELLQFLDGERDVEEVLESVRLSDLEALRTLDRLVKSGEVMALMPSQLVQVGGECEKEGRLEKARKLYLRAEAAGLDQLDLPNRIAKIADALGFREEAVGRYLEFATRCKREELPEAAIAAYRKALEIDASSLPALEGIVEELVMLERGGEAVGILKQLAGRYDPATDRDKLSRCWTEVLRLLPEDPDAHRAMARLFLEADDMVQAIVELEELAAIHISRAEFGEAVAVLREILTIDPEAVAAHLQLATTLAQTGSPKEAVEEYSKLAESLSRAGVGGESTNWQFLIDIYEKIASLEPGQTKARQWLAEAYREKADADRAIGHYRGLVEALREQGDSGEVELAEALRQCVKLAPDDLDMREELGQALLKLGKREEAAATLKEARDQAMRAHRFDLARRMCEAALSILPLDLEALKGLARIASIEKDDKTAFARSRDLTDITAAAGLWDDAIEAARKALEYGKDADVRRRLAEALEAKGQAAEAAKELVEAGRTDFADEDYGRARKAAEHASKLDPGLQGARDLLYMLDARNKAVTQAAAAPRPAATERPPQKPTITGGSPDVTIIDRPQRKYGSVVGVADRLRAMQGSFGGAAPAPESEEAAPAPAQDAPRKTMGAAAKFKAFKSGGLFKSDTSFDSARSAGSAQDARTLQATPAAAEPPAAPTSGAPAADPAPVAAAAIEAAAPAEPPTSPITGAPSPAPPAEPPAPAATREPEWTPAGAVPAAASGPKKISAAAKLKQMMGGGAPPPPTADAGAAPAPGGSSAPAAPAPDSAAERIRLAEQGQLQAGGARKAVSAAAKLKNLKL